MRIQVAIPETHVEAPVLDAALESVTRLNESMLEKGDIPSFERGLKHGVRWRPEPPGQEHFDHGAEVIKRKWGDCDDLAPWHAASLRHSGEDPGATAIVHRSGPKRWHAVVQRSDGSIDDPSRRAGMGRPVLGVVGAAVPLMYAPPSSVVGAYMLRPQIALRPVRGAWQARADLPWTWREHLDDKPSPTDYAMTMLHTAPLAATALTGAIDGVIDLGICGGFADPDHVERLSAIADACSGVGYDELRGVYGDEHARAALDVVGSFFSSIANIAKSIVAPIAKAALPFIPGVGPVLSKGVELAEKAFASAPAQAAAQVLPGFRVAPSVPGAARAARYAAAPARPAAATRPAGTSAQQGGVHCVPGQHGSLHCVPFG